MKDKAYYSRISFWAVIVELMAAVASWILPRPWMYVAAGICFAAAGIAAVALYRERKVEKSSVASE